MCNVHSQSNERRGLNLWLTSCSCFFLAASSFFIFFSSSICERRKPKLTDDHFKNITELSSKIKTNSLLAEIYEVFLLFWNVFFNCVFVLLSRVYTHTQQQRTNWLLNVNFSTLTTINLCLVWLCLTSLTNDSWGNAARFTVDKRLQTGNPLCFYNVRLCDYVIAVGTIDITIPRLPSSSPLSPSAISPCPPVSPLWAGLRHSHFLKS